VPWARHGAGHTRAFDDQVAWLATHSAKSIVCELLRVAWRTVGGIIDRVVTDAHAAQTTHSVTSSASASTRSATRGRLRRWHQLDRGRRRRGLSERDGLHRPVPRRRLGDSGPRRNAARGLERGPVPRHAGAREDPERLPLRAVEELRGPDRRQEAKLTWIAKANKKLYSAYLLKEQLRVAIRTKGDLGLSLLEHWRSWAARSRIPAFVERSRKIGRHLSGIEAALREDISNALIESTNTKLRLLQRMAFGFKEPEHLIALALLDRGGYCPPLPGRS
jgi:transposase